MIDQPLIDRLSKHADALPGLECDGMTRVASYLLSQAGIDHFVCCGLLRFNAERGASTCGLAPHLWLEVGEQIIDYRAKMWLPQAPEGSVPHGVFKASDYTPGARYLPCQFRSFVTGQGAVGETTYKILLATGQELSTELIQEIQAGVRAWINV